MADTNLKQDTISCDVVVVGTGGAGMVAATRAHDRGLDVLILEKTDKVGGATAASGGMIWIPRNHHMSEVGATDSKEEVMTYLRRLSNGRVPEPVMETYVDTTPEMIEYIEKNTPLKLLVTRMPDYRQNLAGSKPFGRSLTPQLFDSNRLGEWTDRLRPAPLTFLPVTIEELFGEWHGMVHPEKMRWDIISERMQKGMLGCGQALAAGLLLGCLDRKIKIHLEARARRLLREDDKITGLIAEIEGKETAIRANRGVILACGGFEWNQEYIKQFLPGPLTHPVTPPYAEGDGLKMAMDVGADLGNMTEAWGLPALQIPGEEHEGKPLSRISMIERSLPHSIMVNRRGKRFVNEACNYNDLYKSFYTFNPSVYEYENLPAWLIFDKSYRDQYGFMTVMPKDPDPEWLNREDTLAALAEKVEVDPKGLEETVERFNKLAEAGADEDFLRGGNVYDRYFGDIEHGPNPCLGPIGKPPFYALPVYPGACGTKGGPKVNKKGQVINAYGEAISGLYAAGNVMAVVSGPGYGGNGGTIGPAMTWGYICADNV